MTPDIRKPFLFSTFQHRILALVGDQYEGLRPQHARDLLADLTAERHACTDPARAEHVRSRAASLSAAIDHFEREDRALAGSHRGDD